jgi:hypothetical protein
MCRAPLFEHCDPLMSPLISRELAVGSSGRLVERGGGRRAAVRPQWSAEGAFLDGCSLPSPVFRQRLTACA